LTTLTPQENHQLSVAHGVVKPEWIDINGHMNVAYYVLAFDLGVDALWGRAGITDDYIEQRQLSTFAVESHITYQAELKLGDPYRVDTQILAVDEKRLHQFQSMYHAEDGYLVATAEWLNLHVNLETRRVCPFPDDIRSAFIAVASKQSGSSMPVEAGRRMQVGSPLYAIDGYHDDGG
jgi:acyl-CoA thioester hydrolase